MALVDTTWYCNAGDQSTTGHYAVTKWAASTAVAAGVLRRQNATPTVGNERVFVCIVAGTTGGSEPAWTLTRGAKTTDNTVTWMECTGQAALNGDLTNTAIWAQVKAVTPAVLGQIIKRSNNASYQICTTAGAMSASEPAFSDTAGVTTTDTTAVWTSLGVVGNFTGGQAPFARFVSVFGSNWFTNGNTVYVGDNHAEAQASNFNLTINAVSQTIINKILCHNHSGPYPPAAGDLMTGASISTTGNFGMTFNAAGPAYFYGVAFKAGVGGTTGSAGFLTFGQGGGSSGALVLDNCSLQIANTASGASGYIGNSSSAGQFFNFNNTKVSFGHVNQYFNLLIARLVWQNTGTVLVSGSSVPTSLFNQVNSFSGICDITLEALDLSQLTGAIITIPSSNQVGGAVLVKDCKLNASATFPTPGQMACVVQLVRSSA